MTVATPSVTDELAEIRTALANERTLLAYLRTGLALVIGSISARELLDDPVIQTLGLVVGTLGVLALGTGVVRYSGTRAAIAAVMRGHG
ncbi:MAG: DUF202 domain-containing protein [Myxococcales bacterium]|nr:DUF202 domain-containing protein [Myxococcales bacterium]MCB9531725.1 DUF202 domain-containing protein [Myxococcales bacterium]